jgi:hypothetical protein
MDSLQEVREEVQDLLDKAKTGSVNYVDLLDLLLKLEKQHTKLITKIQLGVRENMASLKEHMETSWKIAEIANRLRVKIEKKLNE